MRIEVRGRNVDVDDELRDHVIKRFRRVGRQVSELAMLDVTVWEERNPAIADSQVAEATLRLKGVTLHAKEASPEMGHTIHELAEDIRRQVKKHREKRRARRRLRHPYPGGMANGKDMVTRARRVGESRKFKAYEKRAAKINAIEPEMELLGDDELRTEADALRERARNGESLDDLLPEAFALTREAGRRSIGQRHFDVQLVGGMALHDGAIAEMKTGEGKTLTATLAVFLNTLAGDSVHVVTVNDYLARRDALWMKPIYDALGVSVGVIQSELTPAQRRQMCAADVTYGTNSEFGFDYLRDNMANSLEECVQRGHHFAVVDEVDSILIDEARTPLIISGPGEQSGKWYAEFAKIVPRLRRGTEGKDGEENTGDYAVDEKKRTVGIFESG